MNSAVRRIEIKVVNSPTVLVRVIQAVKRRRINISKLVAADESLTDASISIYIAADDGQTRLLKKQVCKLIDVIEIE